MWILFWITLLTIVDGAHGYRESPCCLTSDQRPTGHPVVTEVNAVGWTPYVTRVCALPTM